jgi:hypothetical protein
MSLREALVMAKWVFGVARLALLSVFLISTTTFATKAAPPQAVRAACSDDAQRLCAAAFGNPQRRQACMRQHRAELSAGCKTAIAQWRGGAGGGASRGEGTEVPAGPNRRARCAAYVQDYSFHAGSAWKINGGKAALQRCMHGEALGF